MRMSLVLYLTLITCLVAITVPGSQGRLSSVYHDILSLVCYIRSATSTTLLRYHFAVGANSLLAEDSFSPVGEVGVCRVSAFGIDGICHPLDDPTTPTATLVINTPATRTVSAIVASPVTYKLVLYKDMFSTQPEIKTRPRKSKEFKPKRDGTPSNVEPTNPLVLLSTAASTVIILQLLMVLGQPVVGYLESSNSSSTIPNDLRFHPPAASPGCHHALVISWISTNSSLVLVNPASYVPGDDENSPTDLHLWLLYFSAVLVQSCSGLSADASPAENRATHRHPLMIEAPTSCDVVEVLSFRWFRPHSRCMDEGPGIELAELEDEVKVNPLPLILEIKPAVQSQAPDLIHPSALATTNSLHLADYIDESLSEITYPNLPRDRSSAFHPETSSIEADSSHPDLAEVSKPAFVRSFERVSGRRTTPRIQLECGQVGGTTGTWPPSLPADFSVEPSPLGEYDFGLLSAFPAPPKKVQSLSLLRKVGIGGSFSSLLQISDRALDPKEARRMRLVHSHRSHLSKSSHLSNSAHKVEPDLSSTHRRPAFPSSQSTTSAITSRSDLSLNLPPQSDFSIPSSTSRWSFLTKKSKQKLRKASSSLFTSSNSSVTLHEKVPISLVNASPLHKQSKGTRLFTGGRIPEGLVTQNIR